MCLIDQRVATSVPEHDDLDEDEEDPDIIGDSDR